MRILRVKTRLGAFTFPAGLFFVGPDTTHRVPPRLSMRRLRSKAPPGPDISGLTYPGLACPAAPDQT